MISKSISEKVVTLSIDYENPRGGVAQVVKVYSNLFECFNFIATTKATNFLDKLIALMLAIFKFLLMFLMKNVKIVHIHGASYSSFWRKCIFINLSYLFKIKVIYHIHGGEFHIFFSKYPKFVKQTLQKCDVVIVLSSFWKDFFEKEVCHKKIIIINNIIDKPIKLDILEDKNTCNLLFLGLLSRNKGIYDILEVLHKFYKDYKGKICLYIGGNGEITTVKELICKNQLNEIVKFMGWVSKERKCEVFSNSDIFVLPSYNEGLPISILEAMSYKLPIISTPVGGIPEVVENNVNGLLIEPGNQIELKAAIDKLLYNPELRKRMGEVSYKRSLLYFPENVEKQLEQVYRELL